MKKTVLSNKEMAHFHGGTNGTSWGKEYSVTTTCSDGSTYTDFCAGDLIIEPSDTGEDLIPVFKFEGDINSLRSMELNREIVHFLP